ncbi:MAG TPA: S-methyl-5-thioribose-1-phosphate isomerase [bacterium]|jgi:methylthioribose-1-phosphate isomerase
MAEEIYPVRWTDGKVVMIDQTILPGEYKELETESHDEVAKWIEIMVVRGAPAIGVSAAYGLALAANEYRDLPDDQFFSAMNKARERLAATRPTAVNLFWALERMSKFIEANKEVPRKELIAKIVDEAEAIRREDINMCMAIGAFGAELLPENSGVLTHCNAGALATAGYGTAVGVLRAAHDTGRNIRVFVDETRPRLQGARLTAWELHRLGVPFTLISDNMSGHFMRRGDIKAAVTGADRIAANGDTANKIGTYNVAVLCKEHGIPFYVAAPYSTIDFDCPSGEEIPIEERSIDEVLGIIPGSEAYEGITVANPAFDVTPSKYINAIITDKGVAYPPYGENLKKLLG